MRIKEFAKEHGLTIKVGRRDSDRLDPYYVNFSGSEVKDGPFLRGEYGDGKTPAKALRAYAAAISGKLLVVDAYKATRREIPVPQLNE